MKYKLLIQEFEKSADKERALQMKKYMRDKFEYFGIQSPQRRKIVSEFLKQNPISNEESELEDFYQLFSYPKRECAYAAMDIWEKWLKKNMKKEHYSLIRKWLVTDSWWDTVDIISSHVLGKYMMEFPEQRTVMLIEYNGSDNFWLFRASILFQLNYKEQTDSDILFSQCKLYADSQEFFVQKAMGWALRQYAKVNPDEVYKFVDTHTLPKLTLREANKHRN